MVPTKNQANGGQTQTNPNKPSMKVKDNLNLGEEMYDWALNEMKFMPQGRHADRKLPDVTVFQKLCRGKGREYWEYVIKHVKSAETVNKVKMNLALSKPGGIDNGEASRIQIRHKLSTGRDLLREKVQKQRLDMEKVTAELKKSENDLSRLEASYKSQLGKIDEINQHKLSLSLFSDKCGQDKNKIEDYQRRISLQLNRYKQLLNTVTESSQFYSRPKSTSSDDSGLESACMKDIREACETITKYLSHKPVDQKQSTQQQTLINEKIWHIMITYPAKQILASLIEVTNEVTLDIQLQTQAIDISDDVRKLKFKHESSGRLTDLSSKLSVQQSVDQLIEKSQLEHVLRFVAIQKHKNTICNLEKQLVKTRENCDLSLRQNLGGLPDMLELTKMLLESEINLVGSQAGLKCLHKLDNELTQRHARIELEKANLQQKFQQIQDFDKVANGKQNLIKALVRQTRNTPERLRHQREEILAYIDQSLRPCRNHVTKLMEEVSGNVLNEMKIFTSISLTNLPILFVENLGRLSRCDLDINKFRPELLCQNEELVSALEKLEFPFHQASELLLPMCVDLQQNLSDYHRHARAREVPDCAKTGSKMADILAKVDRHDQLVKERMLPKMERCLKRTSEELSICLELKNLVDIWWEQPGQYTTPWVTTEGKTFQEYRDQWTILCATLRQLQRVS